MTETDRRRSRGIYMTNALYKQVKVCAALEETSVAEIVERALLEWFQRRDKAERDSHDQ